MSTTTKAIAERSVHAVVFDLEHLCRIHLNARVAKINRPSDAACLADIRRDHQVMAGHPTLSPDAIDQLVEHLHSHNPRLVQAYYAEIGRPV